MNFGSKIISALGIDPDEGRPSSFAFSTKPPAQGWEALTYKLPVPVFFVKTKEGTFGQVRTLATGIRADTYILVADLTNSSAVVMRRVKKGENVPLVIAVRREEDFERVANTLKKFNFSSDELTAHAAVSSAVEQLRIGAERYYTNRGLFSAYYLNERFFSSLSKRGRVAQREASSLLSDMRGDFPAGPDGVERVLKALGYWFRERNMQGHKIYDLKSGPAQLEVCCVAADAESLDTKTGEDAVPSYLAVYELSHYRWVILTNGRFWRLYSSRVQSSTTNYFEVDMEGIVEENNPKLRYFVGLFSAASFVEKEGSTDVDLTFDGGVQYAKDIEDDLRKKVFEGKLFLYLVKAIVDHSLDAKYSQPELEAAKESALKLLYRLLFVLYAESRDLLPVEDKKYETISLDSLRRRIQALEKEPGSASVWEALLDLFRAISVGRPEASVPVYDGELFESDEKLDTLKLKNEFLVPALRDLSEFGGQRTDYQNLGVRHLGSLYEALLEYSVKQAEQDLVIYKEKILDASYAADINAKPSGYIKKGDLYLTAGGLARKGTGSYFTPDEIVSYLAKKGLESHFRTREEQFLRDMIKLRSLSNGDKKLEEKTVDDLLGLKVVDPAMGSGHFLVAVVNEITKWVIGVLKENPDAPLQKLIEQDRQTIIIEQFKNGISLDENLLTDGVILKRMVMKRCVYGVDVNRLAVELSKLSLWLDSFTIGTPLTFLDHHIKWGDALIGLWLEGIPEKTFESTLDTWAGTLTSAVSDLFWKTSTSADLTLEQVNQSRETYQEVRERTGAGRTLLDLEVARILDSELGKKLPRNVSLIQETSKQKQKPLWWAKVEEGLELTEEYRTFHWEFEFPEAFTEEVRGFDVVITNPPWDVIKPEDDDFFSAYDTKFRMIPSKPLKRKVMAALLRDLHIAHTYEDYKGRIERKVLFFKNSHEFVRQGGGDTNLWKLFLERSLKLLSEKGSLSIVIPSSIVTDEGAKELREALFDGKVESMYEFENRRGIFPAVDSRYKFVLLNWTKTTSTQSFNAAFYLHDINALGGRAEEAKFIEMPLSLVRRSAPETLSIPEVRSKDQFEVFAKVCQLHPLLNDQTKGWSVAFVGEFHRTNDSDLFRTDGKGWPLFEGKSFQQFYPNYERPMFTVDSNEGLKRASRIRYFTHVNKRIHETCRLAFRDVASSTNVRSMIACVLPPRSFCSNKAPQVFPLVDGQIPEGETYSFMVGYLAGILNSMVFDFLIRTRISINMNFFYVYQSPVPAGHEGGLGSQISRLAIRLSSTDERYKEFAESAGAESGPLTFKQRLELTAELNALVARHYGLNRQELEVVLSSFEGFEEDKNLENIKDVKWDDAFIRKFNGEVRKRVLPYFDKITEELRTR